MNELVLLNKHAGNATMIRFKFGRWDASKSKFDRAVSAEALEDQRDTLPTV